MIELSEEEKKAIEWVKNNLEETIKLGQKYGLQEAIKYQTTILNLIQKQDTEINKLNNVIDRVKNKLEEHIKHCEQEAKGSLNNEICNISLKFDKGLLEIINKEDK